MNDLIVEAKHASPVRTIARRRTDSVPRTIVSGYLDLEVGRNF